MILDSETAAFIKISTLLQPLATIQKSSIITFGESVITPQPTEMEKWIRGRVEFVQAGVDKCPEWFVKQLRAFDSDLRMRWDFYRDWWIVERFNRLDNLYHACGSWHKPLGDELIEALRQGDMWNMTPGEQIKKAHDLAEAAQKNNDHRVTEELGEALDKMTNRQVEEFVAASEAMAHGEEIVPMGDDAKFMQRIHDQNKELDAKGVPMPKSTAIPYIRQKRDN